MITTIHQDLLSDIQPNTIILNQVNCLGLMGSGLALEIRNKWSNVYSEYSKFCQDNPNPFGSIQLIGVGKNTMVCNAFGQMGISRTKLMTDYGVWKLRILPKLHMTLELLEQKTSIRWKIRCPFGIGCGLGGGNWDTMLGLIENEFKDSKFEFCICKL